LTATYDQAYPRLREKLTTTEFDRLGTDLLEAIADEARTTKELHYCLAAHYYNAYGISLGIYTVQNALDGLVRAKLVRFGGWNNDLYVSLGRS